MLSQFFNIQNNLMQIIEAFLESYGMLITYKSIYIPALLIYSFGVMVSFACISFLYPISITALAEHFVLTLYTAITRRIHLPKHRTPNKFTPSISFMGGGHLWMFAIGVGHYIYENFDIENIKFMASSSGCFAAVPLACGMDPYAWCHRDWAKCMTHFDSRLMGCLCDSKYFYYHLWDDYLPPNAHVRCSGRLFISITEFPSMRNKVISQFESREELIWVIVASMCLPIAFIADFPVNCGKRIGTCFDGGFSNDSPCLDSYTITVSALHREADIKPAMDLMSIIDDSSTLEDVTDYERNIRIRATDVMRTPEFSRVWQVGGIGERSAMNCVDFDRHEWMSIRRDNYAPSGVLSDDEGGGLLLASPTSSTTSSVSHSVNATSSLRRVSSPITPIRSPKRVTEVTNVRTRSSAVKLRSGARII